MPGKYRQPHEAGSRPAHHAHHARTKHQQREYRGIIDDPPFEHTRKTRCPSEDVHIIFKFSLLIMGQSVCILSVRYTTVESIIIFVHVQVSVPALSSVFLVGLVCVMILKRTKKYNRPEHLLIRHHPTIR